MKFSFTYALLAALTAETALASSWFTKAAYNKWHETELERWLSDHDVPYPTPADRKDLENLVKTNWQNAVESPYVDWDTQRMQKYLQQQGQQVKKGTEKNKDALLTQVKSSWQSTTDQASNAYNDVSKWIFDSWTESSLKSFADKHSIPVPQPRKRDVLLKNIRENYQTVANKIGETAAYPGNWLYESWSDSDLKEWLDKHGVPVPQTGKRDKMVAAVRRNAYYGSVQAEKAAAQASASAESAASYASASGQSGASQASGSARSAASQASASGESIASQASGSAQAAKDGLSAKVFDAWSDSQLKQWADKNGIKVPQGSTRNELLAIARKNVAKLTGDNVQGSAASAYGAATSRAGNEAAKASAEAYKQGNAAYNNIYSAALHYADEAMIAFGLKDNYASSASRSAASASKSASSAYHKATQNVKAEL